MTEIICPKLTINGVETTEYQGRTIRQINYNGNTYVLQTAPVKSDIIKINDFFYCM